MVAIKISDVNLLQDYVALTNKSNNAVNLNGWHIIDTTPTNQKRHEFIFKRDFWLAPDAEVNRNSLRRKILPRSSIIKVLKKHGGLSEEDARIAVRAILSRAVKSKDLVLLPRLNKLPKLVDRFNKLFISDILKEIKLYRRIRAWKT